MAASLSRPHVFPSPVSLGLVLTLSLALGGQVMLSRPDTPLWLGLSLYAVASVLYVLNLRQAEAGVPPFVIGQVEAPARPPRLAFWLTATVTTAMTVQGVLAADKTPLMGRWLVVLWAVSILVYSLSVLRAGGWVARLGVHSWWQTHRRDALIAAAFAVLAFGVRVYALELHPYAFINDEGEVGKEALRILRGERTNFFDAGWASQPVWAFVPAAVSVGLLGHTAFAVRLVSVVHGALTVSLVYLLGGEWFGRLTGGLAATLLLGLPFHIHFSRLGVNNVGDAFYSTLTLWLTYRAIRRGTPAAYLLAGLATGLALYTYLGSRLAIALVIGSLAYVALRFPGFVQKQSRSLAAFAGAGLVVALPMAAYFFVTPNQFYARLNTEGILNNGYLQRQAAATGQSYVSVLLDQFSRSSLVYVARPAVASFFNSPEPYLTPLASIFFVLGLAYTAWHLLDPRCLTLTAWFWSVVILGSTLTVGPPSSQRLLMSAPAVALLAAVGLEKTAGVIVHERLAGPRLGLALCGLAAAATAVQGLVFYFGDYRTGHYFEDPGNDFSYEVATYADSLGPDYRLYLLGEPSSYAVFGDFGYLAPDVAAVDYNTVTPATLADLPRDKGALFAAVPGRLDDLRLVQQWVPGGTWREVHRRFQVDQWAYFAYVVPPQVFAGR